MSKVNPFGKQDVMEDFAGKEGKSKGDKKAPKKFFGKGAKK